MLKFTNKKQISIEFSILNKSDKNVLKFKRLPYTQGPEVSAKTGDCKEALDVK